MVKIIPSHGRFSTWLPTLFQILNQGSCFPSASNFLAQRTGKSPGDWQKVSHIGFLRRTEHPRKTCRDVPSIKRNGFASHSNSPGSSGTNPITQQLWKDLYPGVGILISLTHQVHKMSHYKRPCQCTKFLAPFQTASTYDVFDVIVVIALLTQRKVLSHWSLWWSGKRGVGKSSGSHMGPKKSPWHFIRSGISTHSLGFFTMIPMLSIGIYPWCKLPVVVFISLPP